VFLLHTRLIVSVSPLPWLADVEDRLRKRVLLSLMCKSTSGRANWILGNAGFPFPPLPVRTLLASLFSLAQTSPQNLFFPSGVIYGR